MPIFLEAASTPEHKLVMLTKVLDSIAVFGNSGLLSEKEDNVSLAKLVLDRLMRPGSGKSE